MLSNSYIDMCMSNFNQILDPLSIKNNSFMASGKCGIFQILAEMENVIYFKHRKGYDFGQFLDPPRSKDYPSRTSEKFKIFRISASILNFLQKWKMLFILRTARDKSDFGQILELPWYQGLRLWEL